ncbi:hypothetical protein E4U59_007715 [Claviceps monticola]|nr:hypothetical protein E4U59_007715 [Claviceps monticola]
MVLLVYLPNDFIRGKEVQAAERLGQVAGGGTVLEKRQRPYRSSAAPHAKPAASYGPSAAPHAKPAASYGPSAAPHAKPAASYGPSAAPHAKPAASYGPSAASDGEAAAVTRVHCDWGHAPSSLTVFALMIADAARYHLRATYDEREVAVMTKNEYNPTEYQ